MEIDKYINKIICADSLDIMRELPDKSIDLVLTDPPYGIHKKKATGFKDLKKKKTNNFTGNRNDIIKRYTEATIWDNEKIKDEYFIEIMRIAKKWIIWGGNYYAHILGDCKEPLIWNKLTGNNYFADGEMAFTNGKGTLRIFTHQWSGALKDSERGQQIHATQKPIILFQWCIRRMSKENDIILDCFAGSGTTAIACYEINRRFICIEKEKKYCEIAEKRLKEKKECYSLIDGIN